MGLLNSLSREARAGIRKDTTVGAALPTQGFLPMLGGTPSATGLLISQGTAMAVSAVYACVSIRAQDVARCTPRLVRTNPKSGTVEQIREHDVAELFKRPNKQQTWYEFCEQTEIAFLLRGNGYAAIRRSSRAEVQDLIPINPDAVMVLESYNGDIFYNVNRIGLWQLAMLRDFPVSIPEEDIFHLRGLSFNALVGASTIGLARDAIGVSMGLEQQAARWMANGARPSGVLEAKKALTDAAAKRLKANWDDFKSGLQNTGQTVILEEGLTFKELALTSVDLAFMEQRKFGVVEICRYYDVPPYKLGATELRGIDIEEINNEYVSGCIMRDLERLETKIEQVFDLDRQGIEVKFDERVLLRSATKVRFANNRIALGGAAFATVNEVRAGEQLPPVEGGDVIYQPTNLAGLGSDKTGGAPDGAGRPADGEMPTPAPATRPPAESDGEGEGKSVMRFTLPPVGAPFVDPAPSTPVDTEDEVIVPDQRPAPPSWAART